MDRNWTSFSYLNAILQEIYAELVSKKAKIEEQLKEISVTLSCMEVI